MGGDGSLRKSDGAQLLQDIEELSLHLNTLRRFTGSPASLLVALEGQAVPAPPVKLLKSACETSVALSIAHP